MIRSDFKVKNEKNFSYFYGKIRLKVLVAVAILVATLVFTQLVFANNLALDGQKLSKIDNQIKQLEAENTTLKVKIANVSSLTALAQKAQELRFVKPQKVTIL